MSLFFIKSYNTLILSLCFFLNNLYHHLPFVLKQKKNHFTTPYFFQIFFFSFISSTSFSNNNKNENFIKRCREQMSLYNLYHTSLEKKKNFFLCFFFILHILSLILIIFQSSESR